MVFDSRVPGRSGPHAGELVADYRARLAHEHAERQERRQNELAEQVSIRNMPGERIRIWERLHGLPLPLNPTHNLLSVIAAATDLQLEQVREEQRLRRAGGAVAATELASIDGHLNPPA
ncbi:MAG: hypothetical protein ACJ8R9_08320 [Steroidobacteraceae bacterium]